MLNSRKGEAILQLLNKSYYRNALLIDFWDGAGDSLINRCDSIFKVTKTDLAFNRPELNRKFDLVISCSPSVNVRRFLESCCFYPETEVVFVVCHDITYNIHAVNDYKRTVNIVGGCLSLSDSKCLARTVFSHGHIHKYYPFPSVLEPELILFREGFSDYYRRYWAWFQTGERSMLSFFAEYICVPLLGSHLFAPFTIVKVN